MAEPTGVEPIPARSKQAVLPLHHDPKSKKNCICPFSCDFVHSFKTVPCLIQDITLGA